MNATTGNTGVQSVPSQFGWSALNALQLVFTLLWTAGWGGVALLLLALGVKSEWALRIAAQCWAPGLLAVGKIHLVVEGADNVDWSKPYLLVSNHQSAVDICALYKAVPAPLRFVMKGEMLKVPFINWYAKATGMPFLDRDSHRAGAIVRRQAAALLGQGRNLCLFPEGTRSRTGVLAPFKAGLLQSAIDAGVAVVPIALDGCGKVLPVQGLFRVRPGIIRVRIGHPIAVRQDDGRVLDRQTLADRAHESIRSMLEPRV